MTVLRLAPDRVTVNWEVPSLSPAETSFIDSVGVGSSSVIVAVCVVVAPSVAFVGLPRSTTTVSSFSSKESPAIFILI